MTRTSWPLLAETARATNTNFFRKLPLGITPGHERFLDSLNTAVEAALTCPRLDQLDCLADLLCAEVPFPDMASLNQLLELYRILKMEDFERNRECEPGVQRAKRALFRELWHLTRWRVQARLGLKTRRLAHVLFERGTAGALPVFHAWCDGSFRRGKGYAGLLLRDPELKLLAMASVRVPAETGTDTEVQALTLVLRTAATLGVRALEVYVDAAGLASYAGGTAALRYCVDESVVQRSLSHFDYVRMTNIPRLYNAEADELSRALKD